MALNLVTRAEYKTYAGISSTNQDAILDFIIPRISALVKTYCRRTFVDWVDVDKTEIYNGDVPYIVLQESPVVSITSFSYSTDYGQTWTALTQYEDWVLEDNMLVPIGGTFPKYLRGYKVVYKAGYDDVPVDLALAVFDLISFYLKNEGTASAVKRTNTNTMQIEYITDVGFPSHIRRVLDQYVMDYN